MPKAPATDAQNPDIPTDMTTVYMGLLKRGDQWTPDETPETEQLQVRHLAYIRRLAESGRLIMAGPFTDDGELRGVFVFRVDSLADAEALAQADPAVQARRLVVELHPWYVSESVLPKQPQPYD